MCDVLLHTASLETISRVHTTKYNTLSVRWKTNG